jgi:hypothetical protein
MRSNATVDFDTVSVIRARLFIGLYNLPRYRTKTMSVPEVMRPSSTRRTPTSITAHGAGGDEQIHDGRQGGLDAARPQRRVHRRAPLAFEPRFLVRLAAEGAHGPDGGDRLLDD